MQIQLYNDKIQLRFAQYIKEWVLCICQKERKREIQVSSSSVDYVCHTCRFCSEQIAFHLHIVNDKAMICHELRQGDRCLYLIDKANFFVPQVYDVFEECQAVLGKTAEHLSVKLVFTKDNKVVDDERILKQLVCYIAQTTNLFPYQNLSTRPLRIENIISSIERIKLCHASYNI